MPSLFDHGLQHLPEQRGDVEFHQLASQRILRNVAQSFIVERCDHVTHQSRRAHSHPALAASRAGEKAPHRARHIHSLHSPRDYFACQEVAAQKIGQGSANSFLVARNYRSVRNRNAKRMAE